MELGAAGARRAFLGASDDEGDGEPGRFGFVWMEMEESPMPSEQHVAPQRDAELDEQRQQAHVDAGVRRVEVAPSVPKVRKAPTDMMPCGWYPKTYLRWWWWW